MVKGFQEDVGCCARSLFTQRFYQLPILYEEFTRQLPIASTEMMLKADELTYADLCRAIEAWLKDNA
jgi:hypothetical protein